MRRVSLIKPTLPEFVARLRAAISSSRGLGVGVVTALLSLALYASGVSSTVTYGGDCGELIAASYRLAIAHPTGYPLYSLLGRTFASLLPLGEIAWRYNILSALCGAFAAGIVAAVVFRLNASGTSQSTDETQFPAALWPSLGAGLLLAGFHDFWSQSVLAEVYALNALMLAALIYAAVAWHQSAACHKNVASGEIQSSAANPDWRWFYSLAALFGLALNAHLSCVFLAPGLLLYAVVQHRARFGPASQALRRLAIAILFCAATYALTLYLPLRSSLFPEPPRLELSTEESAAHQTDWWPLDWTHPADVTRWKAHVSAQQYKHLLWRRYAVSVAGREFGFSAFAQPVSESWSRLAELLGRVALSYLWCAPLLLVGLWQSFRSPWRPDEYSKMHAERTGSRWLGALLLLTFALNVGVQINYMVSDQSNFFFPAYIVLAIWLGFGLSWVGRVLRAPRGQMLVAALVSATVCIQWILFAPFVSQRGETAARDTALDRTQTIENLAAKTQQPPSVILFGDDALWSFWYAKYVLNRAQNARTPWNTRRQLLESGRLNQYVAQLQKRGPVALSGWDAATDRRFPYVLLNESGTLALASQQVLPDAATLLNHRAPSQKRSGNIIDARFRSRHKNGSSTAKVKRENMAAFEIDFRLPWITPLDEKTAQSPTIDAKNKTMHVGFIEVFLAPAKGEGAQRSNRLPPDGRDIRKTKGGGPSLLAWKQTRRLIAPQSVANKRQLLSTRWRAVVPLYMETDAMPARYDVWVRLVRSPRDRTTAWKWVTQVKITAD